MVKNMLQTIMVINCISGVAAQPNASLVTRDKKESLAQIAPYNQNEQLQNRYSRLQESAKFILAASHHDKKEMERALAAGANVNAQLENHGVTALIMEASQPGSTEILNWLLKQPGIDPNMTDHSGQTALHRAAYYDNLDAIKSLLQHPDIQINKADPAGQTPLHRAALAGKNIIVLYLINSGANLDAKDKNGQTPLDLARINHQATTEKILASYKKMPLMATPLEDNKPILLESQSEIERKLREFRTSPEHMSRYTPEELEEFHNEPTSALK